MAIILFVCTLVTAISAAPTTSHGVDSDWQKELVDSLGLQNLQEVYRGKRSGYGNVYMSPCAAAAASSPIPAYAQATASAAPVPTYASPSAGLYPYGQPTYHQPAHGGHLSSYYRHGHPYYRADEELEEQETLGFSDMNTLDHMPTARYSYDTPQVTGGGGVGGASQAAGPMVGVFSNAKVGGCSVPLLVSCSPSIAQGQIVKAHPYYGGVQPSYQANAYRFVEEHPHHAGIEMHQEKSTSSEHPETKPSDSNHQ